MTLRIDAELKAAAERAAAAAGTTLTDFVVNAMKNATNPVCRTCGRSSPSAVLSPGFSDAFAEFHKSLCGPAVNTPFVLFTLEGTVEKVYWGRLRSIEPLETRAGVIMIDALLGWQSHAPDWVVPADQVYPLAIPRGVIQGWRTDAEGRLYLAQCTLGYADGNEPARRAYHASVAQRMPPTRSPGR